MTPASEAERIELAASESAPFQARQFAERVAGQLSAPLRADLMLVVTELVTNSVRYGPGRPITVSLLVVDPQHAHGEVIDAGASTTAQRITDTNLETPGGLGLMLVDRLSRRWGVRAGSTHVWFELGPAR
jgi:anti-sigma regulatory factor (Ser/Thr protein kinase)